MTTTQLKKFAEGKDNPPFKLVSTIPGWGRTFACTKCGKEQFVQYTYPLQVCCNGQKGEA